MFASTPLVGVHCRESFHTQRAERRLTLVIRRWVYVADIFPTRTRHFGLATASASQWLFNFVVSKVTPDLVSDLGYKIFFMFATINIGGMAIFSL